MSAPAAQELSSYQSSAAAAAHNQHVSPQPPAGGYPGAVAPAAASYVIAVQPPAAAVAAAVPPPPAAAAGPPILLPPGAVMHNGGILFPHNVFSNAYSVPTEAGTVWYDAARCPLPPQPPQLPSLQAQWAGLTGWLQLFVVLTVCYWLLHFWLSWEVGLCIPILFIPSYLLYRQWQKHYQEVELYLLVKLYALAAVPGALVVMVVESVITVLFMFICFQSAIHSWLDAAAGKNADATSSKGGNDDSQQAPDGMEFLNFPHSPAFFVFLFLLSYVSAGCCEESLKYYCIKRVHRYRPAYRSMRGVLLYALAAALGFSTMENLGYVLGGALGKGGDNSLLGVLLNTLGRAFISTPLHLCTAYLIALQVIRRDLLGERLNIVQVMGWSVFLHGSFDFGLFLVLALQDKWSSGPDDTAVSYVLMAVIVVNVGALLAWRIWKTHRHVFPPQQQVVEHAVDHEVASGHGAAAAVEDGSGLGAVQVGRVNAQGFQRLQQHEPVPAAMQAV